jgi:hypothetical protein
LREIIVPKGSLEFPSVPRNSREFRVPRGVLEFLGVPRGSKLPGVHWNL